MNDAWSVRPDPCEAYLRWGREEDKLFALPEWAQVIESLGASVHYSWHKGNEFGALVAVFRRGPLRVGVLGFPIAGGQFDRLSGRELNNVTRSLCRKLRLDLLRINTSMQSGIDASATGARPDAWIKSLSGWSTQASKRRRKDLAFAKRVNPTLQVLCQHPDPVGYHAIYDRTVRAHGGKRRYTAEYFRALASVSETTSLLRHFSIVDSSGALRGFAVMARHGDCAYYLHGGSDEKGRREGVADLLLEAMIQNADGCERFNLMASPWEQPGLLRFKRKWSDTVGLATTYDIPGSMLGGVGRALLRARSKGERKAAADTCVPEA